VINRLRSRTFQTHANPTERSLWRSGSGCAVPNEPFISHTDCGTILDSWRCGIVMARNLERKGTLMSQDILELAINGLVTQLPAELIGAGVVAAISTVVVRLRRRKNRED
jgi:hypothetical protein